MSHVLARLTSSHGVGEESMAVECRRCRCIFGSSLRVRWLLLLLLNNYYIYNNIIVVGKGYLGL